MGDEYFHNLLDVLDFISTDEHLQETNDAMPIFMPSTGWSLNACNEIFTQMPEREKTISAVNQHQNGTTKKHPMQEMKTAIALTLTSNEMQLKRIQKYTILSIGSH